MIGKVMLRRMATNKIMLMICRSEVDETRVVYSSHARPTMPSMNFYFSLMAIRVWNAYH